MIPYTSCMCFGADRRRPARRRTWRLVTAQKDTSLMIGKNDPFCLPGAESEEHEVTIRSALSGSETCMLEALKNEKRLPMAYAEQEVRVKKSRQPVITRVLDLNLLDDTYAGITKVLLSKCNSWSFNTFNLDVATGGRSLSYLLVHLFQEYGFVDFFRLDIVKVWHCFNLMEAAYHRHNPYHNSVHAADVTQAMHCFLQETKFSAHLTPLEAMSSVIAAVAHDLDHPGVTQAFLVATSNHLVNLYQNSSVLENHHWRTAISCLSESGIFSHLDKEVWYDIQRQIRSLILATDITRQKEFLSRFKNYLNSESLDMEQAHYRHFALQIALKCADLCNPCRPWAISQRWSYQVCQEFYRQGAYERQLKLPLTPTFDCSRTKVAKIQADFFEFVVSPLFETWDHFLKTPLSSQLLKNLRHNYTQWQHRIESVQQTEEKECASENKEMPQIKIDSCSSSLEKLSQPPEEPCEESREQNALSVETDVVMKQHRSKSDSGLTPRLLLPKVHMETYSTEELHPSTTLLSLSSITNTVQLRQVYATTKVESHLICPTVFQPLLISNMSPKHEASQDSQISSPQSPSEECCESQCETTSQKEDDLSESNAQNSSTQECQDGCCTPCSEMPTIPQMGNTKKRSQSLVSNSEISEYRSQILMNRRASDFTPYMYNKLPVTRYHTEALSNHQLSVRCAQKNNERKARCLFSKTDDTAIQSPSGRKSNLNEDTVKLASRKLCSNKKCSGTTCICGNTDSYKITPSWCWHISRSFSAERPQKPTHDFDSPLPSWQGSLSSLTYSNQNGRRGSAPVVFSFNAGNIQVSGLGEIDSKGGLRGGAEESDSSGRRWSIPMETISGLQLVNTSSNPTENVSSVNHSGRRHSFGLLEPLLALSALEPENGIRRSCSPALKPNHHSTTFSSHEANDELNEHIDSKTVLSSETFLPSLSSSHQASVQRRGSLPAEVPIALMRRVASPSHHIRNKIKNEQVSSSKESLQSTRTGFLWDHARKHGTPGDLLSVLIGPSGMLNTMHGIVSSQTMHEWPCTLAQENLRRRSGGLEMLSGLWKSRTSEVAIGIGMANKLKLHRQLQEDWASWRKEEGHIRPTVNKSPSISALGRQFMYQQRRGSVPLNVSLLSLSSENICSGEQAD